MSVANRMHGVVVGISGLFLVACAAGSTASPSATAAGTSEPPAASAQAEPAEPLAPSASETPSGCLSHDDCPEGVCEGQGCGDDQPGQCAPVVRACTKDLRPYCGCDGRTFRTSGRCPGRRFAHRGPCEETPAAEP